MAGRKGNVDREMKVVILAGGRGTRISEESVFRPKPMVTIGGMPILWHIMKIYASFGFHEFIICCGYKGEYIKDFFVNYGLQCDEIQYRMGNLMKGYMPGVVNGRDREKWSVILANTGYDTLTAGRILKIKDYIGEDKEFMLTYGDGVADIDINSLLEFHHRMNKIVTISTTKPEGRFGAIEISPEHVVKGFKEKARKDQAFVNMGYMVMKRSIFEYLDEGMLEGRTFETLAGAGELAAYIHEGFWSPMDNISDRTYLEKLWGENAAKWKVW